MDIGARESEGACEEQSVPEISPLLRLWYVRLPRQAAPFSTSVAAALADGAWLAAWPRVAMVLPPAALALGFLAPSFWPGIEYVYTESLPFLILSAVLAVLSSTAGIFLLVGHSVGDALHAPSTPFGHGADLVPLLGGRLIGDLLLALLVFWVPQTAKRLAESASMRIGGLARAAEVQAVAFVGAAGMLVYLWSQATVVLIRPVFTWLEASPTVAAVAQAQVHWVWMVGSVAFAAAARVVLERLYVPDKAALVDEIRRSAAAGSPEPLTRRIPPIGRVAMQTALTTFLLSGAYDSWVDGLLVATLAAALGAWRLGLWGRLVVPRAAVLTRIPAIVRFAAIPIAGYVVANTVLELRWGEWGMGLRPVLLGALMTLAIYFAAFPASAARKKRVAS